MAQCTGPKMMQALWYIADHQGCDKLSVSRQVGPNGSNRYGYWIVDRCIKHGLVSAEITPRGYQLTLTPAGRKLVSTP